MDAPQALEQLGGIADRTALLRLTTVKRLRTALRRGEITRARRGRYRLADADKTLVHAAGLGGLASHLSAARLHEWEVAQSPSRHWVTVPRNSKAKQPKGVQLVWADLTDAQGLVTPPVRTVIDCARRLAFPTALAVADSALRSEMVDADDLVVAASAVRGKGAAAARRVAAHASPLAANAFESVLRALALEAGLDVRPQVEVTAGDLVCHPDVVDVQRRLAVEADSWEFHSGKEAFQRDCRRYTLLVVHGWLVLRFTWWQVMHDPDWVIACLHAVSVGRPQVLAG